MIIPSTAYASKFVPPINVWGDTATSSTYILLPLIFILSIDTSQVPPPKSKTRTFLKSLRSINLSESWSLLCSLIKSKIAAVGSEIRVISPLKPANLAAASVEFLWSILNDAGTVITTELTDSSSLYF